MTGVHAFTLDKAGDADDALCHARNFAPLYDIDEEAATGTSNGALTYSAISTASSKTAMTVRSSRAKKMGRPSDSHPSGR